MNIDIFEDFGMNLFPKKPDDAKLTNKIEIEENGVKQIIETWEKEGYKFVQTKYTYITPTINYTDEEIIAQLRKELQVAVEQENFELASYLRDEINKLTSKKE